MIERTATDKFWLWLRPVLIAFGICTGLAVVGLMITAVCALFHYDYWVSGTAVIVVGASLLGGTIFYLADRADNPNKYR